MRGERLRDRGIYRLPGGQEVVVSACGGEYCVYARRTWETFGLAEYLLNGRGQILMGGEPTPWTSDDLTDTNLTAGYQVPGGSRGG